MTTDPDIEPRRPDEPTTELDHVTIENEDAPDECGIFPHESSELDQRTNWIVAHDDSFVDLTAMR